MKAQYEKVMVKHVAARLKNAESLGIKASWTTAHHLAALAEVVKEAEDVHDALTECYNISAYQQMLAKKFAPTGHFQRAVTKSAGEAVDSFLALVAAAQNTDAGDTTATG